MELILSRSDLAKDPVLEGLIVRMDERICEATGERAVGTFIEILIQVLPILLQVFANCPKKPKPPTPPNPEPTPTPAQASAWEEAWEMKCRANDAWDEDELDFDDHQVRVTANRIRKQKKKNKEPISKIEAQEIARSSFTAAKKEDLAVMAASIYRLRGE